MITEITHIRDFGVFRSFSGTGLPPCSKFNLFFGWNYSGKTTLSRVFQSLEKNSIHPDYPTARFLLKDSSGSTYDESFTASCNTRVFNEDFRKSNLRWDDAAGFEPIFILGSTNIALQDELDRKIKEKALALEALQKADKSQAEIDAKLSQAQTECATRITRELSVARFDKRHLKPILDGFKGIIPPQLSSSDFQSEKAKALSTDQKGAIPPLPTAVAALTPFIERTKGLIERQVLSSALIQHLVDHPKIASWVEEGLKLQPSQFTCEFCQNTISPDRVAALNAHFSKDYMDLKDALTALSVEIDSATLIIDGAAYVKQNFYTDLHQEWLTLSATLKTCREAYTSSINILKSAISGKIENPFTIPALPTIVDNTNDLSAALSAFDELIHRANERSRTFATTKNAAIETLKRHYASEFAVTNKYFDALKDISTFKAEVDRNAATIKTLDIEILQLQNQLSETVKGAEAINTVLSQFFGKDDIRVTVTNENTFLLKRGTERAKNLSEGEKTAIAFAYFMTKILENKNVVADTIIYIDDPISSLDANHQFNIYSFIKTVFYKFDETATPKHACLCKQLFISTHNFDFFHLIYDWFSKTKKDDHQEYMIERVDQGGVPLSTIKPCADELKKYKSEYLYLFGAIKRYEANPSTDIDVIFNLGNILRRFVEGYLHFKYLTHINIESDIMSLIPNSLECERARKFMHFYSHTLSRGGGMKIADMSEAKSVIDIILTSISNQDPIHFAALNAAI